MTASEILFLARRSLLLPRLDGRGLSNSAVFVRSKREEVAENCVCIGRRRRRRVKKMAIVGEN